MTKLYDSQIVQILPDCLSERAETQAVSYAISQAIKRLIDYCGNIGVFAMLDTMPEYAIDVLAVELDTQYYDTAFTIDTKRRLIKNTLMWYLRAGTQSAVSELVETVFGEGEVIEWFDYGDEPYYFKIITNAAMTPDTDAMFTRMIERVKNVRSHIRAVEIHRTIDHQLYYAGVCAASEYRSPAIIDGYDINRNVTSGIYTGVADRTVIHPAAILDESIQADIVR